MLTSQAGRPIISVIINVDYMQLVTPNVVAMAVRTLIMTCSSVFHVSFFIVLYFFF